MIGLASNPCPDCDHCMDTTAECLARFQPVIGWRELRRRAMAERIRERITSYAGAIVAGGIAGNVAASALCTGLDIPFAASDGSAFASLFAAVLVVGTAIDRKHHTPGAY